MRPLSIEERQQAKNEQDSSAVDFEPISDDEEQEI